MPAHSEKQDATATCKKTFGHHPLMRFVNHGSGGSGEPVPGLLRPGNAGSNTAADHITTAGLARAQTPKKYRRGRRTLIRTDCCGGTHEFVAWLAQLGRWLSHSVGMTDKPPVSASGDATALTGQYQEGLGLFRPVKALSGRYCLQVITSWEESPPLRDSAT